jgi:hypothetical protein
VAILLADLCFNGWYCNWRTVEVPGDYLLPPAHVAEYKQLLEPLHQRILPVRGGSADKDELPPTISRLWGIPSASGYSPLMLKRYQDLLTMTEGGFLRVPWAFKSEDRSFDLLAIRYLFTASGDQRLLSYKDENGPIFQKLKPAGTADVFENRRAFPRCWMVSDVVQLQPSEVLAAIKTSKLPDGARFKPDQTALIEAALPDGLAHPQTDLVVSERAKRINSASITILSAESISLAVDAPRDAFLILSDVFYPGWNATVDGKESKIYCTDFILRGVVVPAGRHTVTFTYKPLSVLIGVTVTLASTLLLFALLILFLIKRRSSLV